MLSKQVSFLIRCNLCKQELCIKIVRETTTWIGVWSLILYVYYMSNCLLMILNNHITPSYHVFLSSIPDNISGLPWAQGFTAEFEGCGARLADDNSPLIVPILAAITPIVPSNSEFFGEILASDSILLIVLLKRCIFLEKHPTHWHTHWKRSRWSCGWDHWS